MNDYIEFTEFEELKFLTNVFCKKNEYDSLTYESKMANKQLNYYEKIVELAKFNKYNGKELLKSLFFKKYIHQEDQDVTFINEQQNYLNTWLDFYLEDSTQIIYPTWYLFYTLMGILKSINTKFLPLDKEAFAMAYMYISEYFVGVKKDSDWWNEFPMFADEKEFYQYKMEPTRLKTKKELEPFLQKGSFLPLYSYFLQHKTIESDIYNGNWKKRKNTHRREWVYCTQDENGKFTIPRIIIQGYDIRIWRISGCNCYGDLEPLLFPIIEKILPELPDFDYQQKCFYDMMKMYSIYREYQRRALTNKEYITLYQMREPFRAYSGKVCGADSRLRMTSCGVGIDDAFDMDEYECNLELKHRIMLGELQPFLRENDMEKIWEIFSYLEPRYRKHTHRFRLHYGNITLTEELRDLPEILYGNLEICISQKKEGYDLEGEDFLFPRCVDGNLHLDYYQYLGNRALPEYVYGDIWLDHLLDAKNVVFPKLVFSDLRMQYLENVDDCIFSESVHGVFDLYGAVSAQNTKFPSFVEQDVCLSSLEKAKDIQLMDYIGGSIALNSLKIAKNVVFAYYIGGNMDLESLEYAENVVFPSFVGGNVVMPNLKVASQVVLPRIIRGKLDISNLDSLEGVFVLEDFVCKEVVSPIFTIDDLLSRVLFKEQELSLKKERKLYGKYDKYLAYNKI